MVANKTKAKTGIWADTPVFNVLQIVALNAVFFVGLAVTMLLDGSAWWVALGVAWGAAAVLTTLTLVIAIVLVERSARNASASGSTRDSAATQGARATHIRLWDADRRAELKAARNESVAETASRPDQANRAEMLRQWDADAQQDAALAKLAGKRDRGKKHQSRDSGVIRRAQKR